MIDEVWVAGGGGMAGGMPSPTAHKTGRISSQKSVQDSLQLSIYGLACRDALDLGTPERVTLYFTESATRMSTTRTDEQLNAARDELIAWVRGVRSGDFAATPSTGICWTCDFAPMCPSSEGEGRRSPTIEPSILLCHDGCPASWTIPSALTAESQRVDQHDGPPIDAGRQPVILATGTCRVGRCIPNEPD